MTKKTFFQEPTKAEIIQRNAISTQCNITKNLLNLKDSEYLIIKSLRNDCLENPNKFLKHGPEIKVNPYITAQDAEYYKIAPVFLRKRAYENQSRAIDYCCDSFYPLLGNDRRKRRINLVEILDGARLYNYGNKFSFISVKPYDSSLKVEKEGADIILEVLSTSKSKERYNFKLSSIPVADNNKKFSLPFGIASDHMCESKRYSEIRYNLIYENENSRAVNLCKHEIAGYYSLIDFYWNQNNKIPFQISPIAMPSRKLTEVYKRLLDSTLIFDVNEESKDKLRKPNNAEKQVILNRATKYLGFNETLFPSIREDGKLKDYDWTLRF